MSPAETDILCEGCGYTLNGLPESGRCPECGTAIDISRAGDGRKPPLWEEVTDARPAWKRFLITSSQIIFRPSEFFRGLNSRGDIAPAMKFAKVHWIIVSILMGVASWMHSIWSWQYSLIHVSARPIWLDPLMLFGAPIAVYTIIGLIQRLAARLTAWEAAYRGYRLPHGVVLRALYYHTAHWLPVALLGFITIGGYLLLIVCGIVDGGTSGPTYLIVLSAEVILAAAYLFINYWTAMRNLMYANR